MLYNTFVIDTQTGSQIVPSAGNYPDRIEFHNELQPGHNYFQIGIECKLKDQNEILFPPNTAFYITNDEDDNLFYRIVSNHCLTRQDLAVRILDWLIMRNAYYNIQYFKENDKDINEMPAADCASDLSIHALELSGNFRNGFPIYNIDLSS